MRGPFPLVLQHESCPTGKRATGYASAAPALPIIEHHQQHYIMSDSGGDRPSEAAIASKLRDVVIAIHRTGKTEDLTVKRVRARAEQELALEDGFFKTDASWKQKSQDQIVDAVVGAVPCNEWHWV
jgi:hypothetical protein